MRRLDLFDVDYYIGRTGFVIDRTDLDNVIVLRIISLPQLLAVLGLKLFPV